MGRWTSVVALVAAASGCGHGINRGDFNIISASMASRVGEAVARDIERQQKPSDDSGLQAYVGRVGANVARVSHRRDVPYRFIVLDAPTKVNAVSLPGGRVYVYSGLLMEVESEDELAGVLAHEVAHVSAKHGVENLSAEIVAQIGLISASLAINVATEGQVHVDDLMVLAKTLAFLRYSRKQEYEADRLGQSYLVAGRYDSRGLRTFLERVARHGGPGAAEGDGYFRSHPRLRQRIARLDSLIEQQGAPGGIRNEAVHAARVAGLRARAVQPAPPPTPVPEERSPE